MRKGNMIALGVSAAALAALVGWALQPQPVAVEVATVARGEFEQTVSDDGRTRVRDRYVISAPLAGRVERIALKVGDKVEEGQVVAALAPSAPALLDARTERELNERIGTAEAQRLRAAAEAQKVEAQLAQANVDRERARKLSQEAFISVTAREQAELSASIAEKASEAAKYAEHASQHELDQARAALARYRAESTGRATHEARWLVKSPVRGNVLKVVQESAAAVPLGAPLIEIADSQALEAVMDILTQDAVGVKPGMPARIELGPGVAPFAARVRNIEPAAFTKVSALGVEEQRVNVVLDFLAPLDRVQTIGDGFRLDGHIVVYRTEDAVKIPVGALFRDGGGWAMFVVENDRAMKRAVKITRRNGTEVMVDAGAKAGETVVVYPSDALKDGARITVRLDRRSDPR